jgi:hypothetical protein
MISRLTAPSSHLWRNMVNPPTTSRQQALQSKQVNANE